MAESAPKKIKTNDDATDKLQVDDGDSKPSAIPHDEFIHDECLRIYQRWIVPMNHSSNTTLF